MRKYITYKYILLYGMLALTAGFYINSFISHKADSYETSLVKNYTAPTLTPAPQAPPEETPDTVFVRDAALVLGDNTETLIRKFGHPARIAVTAYDYSYYIYNNDYKKLLFVAVREDQVIGFYTDSVDFQYMGISYGATLTQVNHTLKENFTLTNVLAKSISGYKISILMDTLDTGNAVGIYVISDTASELHFDDEVFASEEQIIYDLTNSARVRNELAPYSWSSSAGQAARLHSQNMASENFFGHNDPSLRSPGDRLNAEGISYQKCSENIIAGYDNVILASHGWYISERNRKNLLSDHFRYLGVGFAYDKDSTYQTYITQIFYR